MKTIGILGGMSFESSAVYYRRINELARERRDGLASAPLLMMSFDFQEVSDRMQAGEWDVVGGLCAAWAEKLESIGAEAILIATNTVHKVAPLVEAAIAVPLLHVVDAVGREAKARGLARLGLLGTRFTMEESFYADRLREDWGVEVVRPDESHRAAIDEHIFGEMCRGVFSPSAAEFHLQVIDELAVAGAQGVILGCTEIPMLLEGRTAGLPMLDTTELHCRMAVDWALS
jgi:aspartate racemase